MESAWSAAQFKEPFLVPAQAFTKSHHASCSDHTSICAADEVIIAPDGSAQEDAHAEATVQLGALLLRQVVEYFLTEVYKPLAHSAPMKLLVGCFPIASHTVFTQCGTSILQHPMGDGMRRGDPASKLSLQGTLESTGKILNQLNATLSLAV